MRFQHVTFKAGNMRKAEEFVVYPHNASDEYWHVQSDHRVARIYRDGRMILSKYVANYPTFVHLSNVMSPVETTASPELLASLEALQPTGKIVQVTR